MKNFFYTKYFLTLLFICINIFGMQTDAAHFAHHRLLEGKEKVHDVFFTSQSKHEIEALLVGLIDSEKTALTGAFYDLGNRHIVDAMVNAKKRGVDADIIIDPGALQKGVGIATLVDGGIEPFIFEPGESELVPYSPIMHQKNLIFTNALDGREVIATGSMNFTSRGPKENFNNLVITEKKETIIPFLAEHNRLKQKSHKITQREIEKAKASRKKSEARFLQRGIVDNLHIPQVPQGDGAASTSFLSLVIPVATSSAALQEKSDEEKEEEVVITVSVKRKAKRKRIESSDEEESSDEDDEELSPSPVEQREDLTALALRNIAQRARTRRETRPA